MWRLSLIYTELEIRKVTLFFLKRIPPKPDFYSCRSKALNLIVCAWLLRLYGADLSFLWLYQTETTSDLMFHTTDSSCAWTEWGQQCDKETLNITILYIFIFYITSENNFSTWFTVKELTSSLSIHLWTDKLKQTKEQIIKKKSIEELFCIVIILYCILKIIEK